MPCINLRNTFARWQVIKAQDLAIKSVDTTTTQPELSAVPDSIVVNDSFIKVPRVPKPRRFLSPTPPVDTPLQYRPSVRLTRADLINAESRLGSTIFGPIPAGHRREFFHDQKNIWIWHEDWYDGQHNPHQMTVRYEVRTSGIYKKVATGKYLKLEGDELDNFRKATHAYLYVIKKNLYNRPTVTA